ncbi:hypothetical protein ACLOJK_025365 [Asimina triloba]
MHGEVGQRCARARRMSERLTFSAPPEHVIVRPSSLKNRLPRWQSSNRTQLFFLPRALSLCNDADQQALAAWNSTLLCVPLVSKTIEQMLAEMHQAKANGADLVEVRLDHLADFRPRPDLEILLKGRPLPALITYRCAIRSMIDTGVCRLGFVWMNIRSRVFSGFVSDKEVEFERGTELRWSTQAEITKMLEGDQEKQQKDFKQIWSDLRNAPLPKWEGGQYEGDENKRFDVLRLAMELGAEYIDVELKVAHEFMNYISGNKPDSVKLIVSTHNYQSTPSLEELAELVVQIQATGADIVKIATMGTDITDVARMFQTIVHCQGQDKTTLAQEIYNDRSLQVNTVTHELSPLQKELHVKLEGKHFFIVLDDVLNEDEEKWNAVRAYLTSGVVGSRIFVTMGPIPSASSSTRHELVAKLTMSRPLPNSTRIEDQSVGMITQEEIQEVLQHKSTFYCANLALSYEPMIRKLMPPNLAGHLLMCSDMRVPIIGLVMSERGVTSRLLCPKFGGYLTFCTLDAGKESAPGQPTLKDLKDVYHIRELAPDTKVFGIIGKPVGHSKSPILHNAAFRSAGINAVYVPYLVDNLENFLNNPIAVSFSSAPQVERHVAYVKHGFCEWFEEHGLSNSAMYWVSKGILCHALVFSSIKVASICCSCTIPHKEAAVKCCDEVDPIAKAIGAVNTIIRRPSDGKLIGYNTDYVGAISAIEDGIRGSNNSAHAVSSTSPLAGRLFVVVGAGGAGKALAYGAKEKGARVVIANRTFERARELANLIGGDAITLEELNSFQPEKGMVLANSTSMGMHPKVDETPISQHALSSYSVVFDAVYTPKVTRLLREAESAGATTVSGLEMFIRQAMGQFELFTGLPGADAGNYFQLSVDNTIHPSCQSLAGCY